MLSENLPRRLPRTAVTRNWQSDAAHGAQVLPFPLTMLTKTKDPGALIGRPIAGLAVRLEHIVGVASRTVGDLASAKLVEKPGTAVEAAAQHVDQGVQLTQARVEAVRRTAERGQGQVRNETAIGQMLPR